MMNKKSSVLALYLLAGTLFPNLSNAIIYRYHNENESKIEQLVKFNPDSLNSSEKVNEDYSDIERIIKGLNKIGYFSTSTPKSREEFYNETNVLGVQVSQRTKNNEPIEISGKASFYFPGSNKDPYSGGTKAAVGLEFSEFDKEDIVTVAGSDRFFKMGDYLEVFNPKNGKSAKVLVVDRFAEWIVRKKPDRLIDVRQDTGVSREIELVYGLPKINITRLGRFTYSKDKNWVFEEYTAG